MKHTFRARFLILAVLVILLFHVLGILSPLEVGIVAAVRPIQRTLASWTPFHGASQTGQIEKHVQELEAQVSRLMTENILLKEERRQGAASLGQKSYLSSQNLTGVAATILGRSPEGDEQIIILDHGSESGIIEGEPVITGEGIFVGKVQKSERGRSTVILITDSRSSVGAEIENEQRSPGLVSGQHGLTMVMRYIPQNEQITKDQAVVTSAIDERIPANLAIGIITDKHFSTGDLFQEARLRPLVDLQRLRYVTVITH